MSIDEKERTRYLNGIVTLHNVINNERDIDKAGNIVHDLLLGYDVTEDFYKEFEEGWKDVEEHYLNVQTL